MHKDVLDGKVKPEFDFDVYLETIHVTHNSDKLEGLLKTTPQQRAKRAPLVRNLLRQTGMLALQLAPDKGHILYGFGDTLMLTHNYLSKAMNKPEISSDMALKGLSSYLTFHRRLLSDFLGLGPTDIETGEMDASNLNDVNMGKVHVGEAFALAVLTNMLSVCIIDSEWNWEEIRDEWLSKPEGLKDCMFIRDKQGNFHPYPKTKAGGFDA